MTRQKVHCPNFYLVLPHWSHDESICLVRVKPTVHEVAFMDIAQWSEAPMFLPGWRTSTSGRLHQDQRSLSAPEHIQDLAF